MEICGVCGEKVERIQMPDLSLAIISLGLGDPKYDGIKSIEFGDDYYVCPGCGDWDWVEFNET